MYSFFSLNSRPSYLLLELESCCFPVSPCCSSCCDIFGFVLDVLSASFTTFKKRSSMVLNIIKPIIIADSCTSERAPQAMEGS